MSDDRQHDVQTPAPDLTKGPVGLSGTVIRTRVEHTTSRRIAFTAVISCNGIRCHIVQLLPADAMQEALRKRDLLPPGSHMTAFGKAPDLQLLRGELYLVAHHVITYQLQPETVEPDLFATA